MLQQPSVSWTVEVRIQAGTRGIYVCRTAQTGSGSYPHCYSVGSRILTLGVKWPGHEVDDSPSVQCQSWVSGGYTSAPPICFHGVDRTTLRALLWYLVHHIHHAHVWLCSLTELSYKKCTYVYWEEQCFCCTHVHPGMAVRVKPFCHSMWCQCWKLVFLHLSSVHGCLRAPLYETSTICSSCAVCVSAAFVRLDVQFWQAVLVDKLKNFSFIK